MWKALQVQTKDPSDVVCAADNGSKVVSARENDFGSTVCLRVVAVPASVDIL